MAAPLRIGILNDLSDGPPGPGDAEHWLRLATDELIDAGRIDRPVEFVTAWGLGLPLGTAGAVERGFRELVDRDVLMIVGPAIGDNALVATPLAERYQVPTLNWAGSEQARNPWMFHLQVGSHEDESIVLARHLVAIGCRSVAIVHDRSPIGQRHLAFLQTEANILALQTGTTRAIAPTAEDAEPQIAALLASPVDAVVYLGLGLAAPAVSRALARQGWQGIRAMNTAGLRGYHSDFAQQIDGWHYVDLHADDNVTLLSLRERLGLAADGALAAAKGYDLGRLVAEGISRAPILTRGGIREGLEQIKWLPAAEGHEGTLLGFGHHDRGALHGRYLVMRQWQSGRSVQLSA